MRSYRAQRTTKAVVLIALALPGWTDVVLGQGKTAVPDPAVVAKAKELVGDVFGKEYDAAKTSAQRIALAKKMLGTATGSKSDPAQHFVLLSVARDIAAAAGGVETAIDAVDRIVQTFDVDPIKTRLECLEQVAGAVKLSTQRVALAEHALSLIDTAVAEEDFQTARRFGKIALEAAGSARAYSLRKEIVARVKEVEHSEQAHAEYQQAAVKLNETPTDPDANLAAGRYLCLVQGDWERGVPMLALGSDPALNAAALGELRAADSPDAHVACGDAWWGLGQAKRGQEKDALLLRAGTWYQEAKRGFLSGLAQTKVRRRLQEIEKIVGAVPKPLNRHSQLPEGTILLMTFEPDTLVSRDDKVFVTDLSGCENHGILSGATPTPDGKAGAALRFHGPDCVLLETLRAHLIEDLKGLSLSFWVRAEYFYGQQFLFNVGSTEERSIDLSFYNRGEFRFLLSTSSGGQKCYGGKAEVGRWYHVVGVWDGTEQRIYVDGQATGKVPTKDLVLNAESVSTEAAQLGAQAKASRRQYRHLRGILDEVAIFNRALSDEEIRRLQQMGLKGQPLTSRR